MEKCLKTVATLLLYFPFAVFLVAHILPGVLLLSLLISLFGINLVVIIGKASKSLRAKPALISGIKSIQWLAFGILILVMFSTVNSLLKGDQLLNQNTWTFVLSFALVVQLIGSAPLLSHKERSRGFYFLMQCLSIFCTLQILFFLLGFRNENTDVIREYDVINKGLMLSLLRIDIQRVLLPFAVGIQYNGILMGFLLTSGVVRLILYRKLSEVIFFVIVPMTSILLTDSRGAMIGSILAITITAILKGKGVERLRIFTIITLCTTLILFIVDTSSILYRTGTDNDLSSGRSLFIYANALSELSSFKWIHMLGYGPYGQYLSGVSQFYAPFITNSLVPESFVYLSLHNAILQLIFDWGYLGLTMVVILLSIVIKALISRMHRHQNYNESMALAVLLYFIILGFSESTFSAANMAFSCFLVAALMLPSLELLQQNQIYKQP